MVTERWKEPRQGEVLNLKPCTYKRSEPYGRLYATIG